jgi:hypothetical protein
VVRDRALGPELLGEPRLVRVARHGQHAHPRVEQAQDRHGQKSERPAAVDERHAVRGRRPAQDRVE